MRGLIRKLTASMLVLAMVVTICPQMQIIDISAAGNEEPYCISYNRPAYSSSDNDNSTADMAVDGDEGTRWESVHGDKPQWFYVDLGTEADITGLKIKWEDAYAKAYKIQFSNDEETWRDVYEVGNEVTAGALNISYKVEADSVMQASWKRYDGVKYKLAIKDAKGNEIQNPAIAPDLYPFTSHPDANGNILMATRVPYNKADESKYIAKNANYGAVKLPDGDYKLVVTAFNSTTSKELSTEEKDFTMKDGKLKEDSTSTEVKDDGKNTDIDFTSVIPKESDRKARYVRIYMTQRATNYGYSFFEFQVYGLNGVAKRPDAYGKNLALERPVQSSSVRDEWNAVYEDVKAENAVDGKTGTSYTSKFLDDQWLYVDLGKAYNIGRVVVNWNTDAGKVYDIQVSNDTKNWTTVYRKQDGIKGEKDDVQLYAPNARYVRVFVYARTTINAGMSIKELEVYEYITGDAKPTHKIDEIPGRTVKTNGKGSYVGQDPKVEAAYLPKYIDKSIIKMPIASNDWWQSAMIKQFGNLMCTLPFKAGYSKKGLNILTTTAGWVPTMGPTDVNISTRVENTPDFYILPDNVDITTAYDRVHDYSDYSVTLQMCDETGVAMTSTHVKGSPYIYCDFPKEKDFVTISSANITGIYNDNGTAILAEGASITTDHFGIEITDTDNKEGTNTSKSYYCITLPANTTVKNSAGKLKIIFNGNDKYLSVGTMLNKGQLNTFYKHGYAFITDTNVTYAYTESMSKIVSTYNVTTALKRTGFENTTMQLLLPHQYKHSAQDSKQIVYSSVRGDMHGIWSNSFETTDTFEGILPEFAMPQSEDFDQNKVLEYLTALVSATSNINPAADAYWEGKNIHPLAMGVLMADQLGETEMRDLFISRLKERLVDWFTYSGPEDISYFIYDNSWGTLYYGQSEFGANWGICDHHFTYGYFVFSAAVLATYDKEFYNDYKNMVDMLIRDYANPSDQDSEYCKFRAYDLYEGHSWAGGYADNNDGNNQESASESLFSWVGMYLWGVLTENDSYRDAGVFGFTNEMEAVKQYWFNYDKDNWLDDWPYQAIAQAYGSTNFFGTFFGGQPIYCYGIHWLPLSEYLTYYGMDQKRAAEIYKGLEDDSEVAKQKAILAEKDEAKKEELRNSYAGPDTTWQHISWTFLSQTDPIKALQKFNENPSKVQSADRANVYWFMNTMKEVGYKTNQIIAIGECSATVYYNETTKKYTAMVWNPTQSAKTTTFKSANGSKTYGTANVAAGALVRFNLDTNKTFALTQTTAPTMKATDLKKGTVKNNISGTNTFDDTQMIELACADKNATIYYTTDGTAPTTSSAKYEGNKILVSSDTTVKAIAVKNGSIDSTYASANIKINGDKVESSENLALGKKATASSENGGDVAVKAVDGDGTSRWQAADKKDDEWMQIDLGSVQAVNSVKITWEAAYASKYRIQTSVDGKNWTTVANVNGQIGEVATTFAATNARYVRMQGVSRATEYGYSIYEFEVYGALQAQSPTITPVSGTYQGTQTVTLSTAVKGAEIKYTLDGSEPTEDSPTYTAPFTITKSTIVKAITYRKGMILSDPTESSIIISGTISLNKISAKVAIGGTVQLAAMTEGAVTWSSSNVAVASVNINGLVTGKTVGTAVITAKTASGKTATCSITVTEAVHITSIELPSKTMEMKKGTSETLELKINPADTTDDTTATWKTSNENVVSVNSNGTLTAKGLGTAKITVSVGNFTAICDVTVVPVPVSEMAANGKYNVALKKNVSVYPGVGEGDIKYINDGLLAGADGYCAISVKNWGYTGESYALIDLGDTYDASTIDLLAVQYKNKAVNDTVLEKTYSIEYSANGVDYTTVYKSGTIAEGDFDADNCVSADVSGQTGAVRYVKVYYPKTSDYGMQVSEIAVLSTAQNLKTVKTEMCDNPADFIVTSDKLCEITYTIKAADNQAGYKYIVFLNNKKITDEPINAGTYTIGNLDAGTYEVKVVSYYDKKTSEGIIREIYVDDGSLKDYVDTVRNLSKGCKVTVEKIEESEGNKDPQSLTDGKFSKDNGICVHTEHKTKTATITMDLGKDYDKNQIDEVLMAFKANNTNATAYNIEFSGDGTNYEKVIDVTGAEYMEPYEDKFDPSKYTQNTVRYVKINLTDGNYEWGYQLSEIAIMGTDEFMPIEAEGLTVTSPADNTIQVKWTSANSNQLYDVYVDSTLKLSNVNTGTYTIDKIVSGQHTVKVVAKLNGITSKGVSADIVVKEAPTTTPQPTTTNQNPVTQKPTDEHGTSENTTTSGGNIGETPTVSSGGNVQITTIRNSADETTITAKPGTTTKVTVKVSKTKVKSASKKKSSKKVKISLKKITGASKYQVQISKKKNFKKKKNILVKKTVKKLKFTIKSKKIKNKKKLYVRARAIKVVNGVKYYGKWSKKKKIKIKK